MMSKIEEGIIVESVHGLMTAPFSKSYKEAAPGKLKKWLVDNKWIRMDTEGEMESNKELEISFVWPAFRPGQEVEALWNERWYRARLIRNNNDGTYWLRFRDGELKSCGRQHKLLVQADGIRKIRRPYHRFLQVEITKFENLGFWLDHGLNVVKVEQNSYAS